MLSGWYGDKWWETEIPGECTVGDMERALSYSLQVVQSPVFSETEISELGLVSTTTAFVLTQVL